MNEKKQKLLVNTAFFAVGNIGSKFLIMLIVPLCTFSVSPADMGTYDIINTVSQLLVPIAMLGVAESLFRWLIDKDANSKLVISNWSVLFFSAIFIFSLAYFLAWIVFRFEYALILYFTIITTCIYNSLQYATRGLRNSNLFAIQGIIYGVIICASDTILVIWLNVGFKGLLYSTLLANVIAISFMMILQPELLRYGLSGGNEDKSLRKQMLMYSIMLVPNGLCWWVMQGSGRLIIKQFLGIEANGIFAIAIKFPSIVAMFTTIFYLAWQEQAVDEFESEGRDKYYTEIFSSYFKLLFSALIIIMPAVDIFINFFTENAYHSSGQYSALLLMGGAFSALAGFYGTGYASAKDTKGGLTSTVYGAVANIGLGFLLVKPLGLQGISLAFMLAQFLIWIVRIVHTRKYFTIKLNWSATVLVIIGSTVFGLVASYSNIIIQTIMLVAAVALFIVINKSFIKNIVKFVIDKVKSKSSV